MPSPQNPSPKAGDGGDDKMGMRGGPTAAPQWQLPVRYKPSGPNGTESGTPQDYAPSASPQNFAGGTGAGGTGTAPYTGFPGQGQVTVTTAATQLVAAYTPASDNEVGRVLLALGNTSAQIVYLGNTNAVTTSSAPLFIPPQSILIFDETDGLAPLAWWGIVAATTASVTVQGGA